MVDACTGEFIKPPPGAAKSVPIYSTPNGATVKYRFENELEWHTAPSKTPTSLMFPYYSKVEFSFSLADYFDATASLYVLSYQQTVSVKMEPLFLGKISISSQYFDGVGIISSPNNGVKIEQKNQDGTYTTLTTTGSYDIPAGTPNFSMITLRFSKQGWITEEMTFQATLAVSMSGVQGPLLQITPTHGNVVWQVDPSFTTGELKNADGTYTQISVPGNIYLNNVPFGTITVRFSHFGYQTKEQSFVISKVDETFYVTLNMITNVIPVTTVPTGVTVEYKTDSMTSYANLGATPSTGSLPVSVPGNVLTFNLRFSKTDYITVTKGYYAPSCLNGIQVTLNSTKLQVGFTSTPSGVGIYKNNVLVGTTPCSLLESENTVVTYKFSKTGYVDLTNTYTYTPALVGTGVAVTLTPVLVNLSMDTIPTGATVEQFNGTSYVTIGTTPLTVAGNAGVPVTMRYSKNGYSSLQKSYPMTSSSSVTETLLTDTSNTLSLTGLWGMPEGGPGGYGTVGETYSVGNSLSNMGTKPSSGGHVVQVLLNGVVVGESSPIPSIPVGQTVAVGPFNVTLVSAVPATTICMKVKTGTPGDNTQINCRFFDVLPPSHAELSFVSAAFGNSSYPPGTPAQLSVVIRNIGTKPSTGGEVLSLKINGEYSPTSDRVLTPLAVNATTTVNYTVDTTSLPSGDLIACLELNSLT